MTRVLAERDGVERGAAGRLGRDEVLEGGERLSTAAELSRGDVVSSASTVACRRSVSATATVLGSSSAGEDCSLLEGMPDRISSRSKKPSSSWASV